MCDSWGGFREGWEIHVGEYDGQENENEWRVSANAGEDIEESVLRGVWRDCKRNGVYGSVED